MDDHRHAAVIGGQRCGSTLLSRVLSRHPDVLVAEPERPEPKFFLSSGDHSEYHRKHFRGDASLFLEKSTTYLERPDAEARMRAIPGGVWPIVILRDPVERAISNWRFSTMNGLETLPAEEAMTDRGEDRAFPSGMSTSPYLYLKRSRYMSLLEPWLEARGVDGISFVVFESLVSSPADVMTELHRELGLRPEDPDALPLVNPSAPLSELTGGTMKRLRQILRPEAEEVARILPETKRVWPTLASV